uniref:Carboxylic ester hydrolase n=1 Tax=Ectropis obliqua TaxID=248899 RepID=A0A2U3T8J4_ECTOB|nr:putative antennal esterase CXE1 [Ectropis obliqua]
MKWALLASLIAASLLRPPAPPVRTAGGVLRGRLSHNGRFYEYLGIPYGTVDERNRFQAPLPPPTWQGVLDAVDENTWCPQRALLGTIGRPDCLKLNVYSPVHKTTDLLPVMVYIHGGCFFGGTGSPFLYGGDYFAENGVVFVGINYRLGVEGFLCLGTKEAPGNAGLKDQIAALRWIRDNIRAFGGNPDDVTLFGESAGAVSTSFMILSPAAKGLFHKAILQSGSSLAPWALQHDPIQTASNLVKNLGYDTKDPSEIYNILSNRTAEELILALKENEKRYCVADTSIFVPCIENDIKGVEPVVTEYPADIIKSGNYTKVPMIIGYTDSEGLYFVSADYGNSLKNGTSVIDPASAMQRDLDFPNQIERNWTAERIKRHYFSSNEDEMIMNMINLYSDLHFKFPLILESELYARTSHQPIYYYLFRYNGLINMPKFISGFGLNYGASHADDLFYLFKPHGFPLPQSFLEEDMIGRMVTLWTNFAKYGDPTPARARMALRWRPSRERSPRALVLDRRLRTAPLWEPPAVALWNDTYARYRRRDYGFKTKRSRSFLTDRLGLEELSAR